MARSGIAFPFSLALLCVTLPILVHAKASLTNFTVTPSASAGTACNPGPQTWTTLSSSPAGIWPYMTLLLTDGTVMASDASNIANSSWWLLHPDMNGCYADGYWTPIQAMPAGYSPLYFASAVLPDGRVIIEGGEYNQGIKNQTNLGAIYDPTVNQWTSVPAPTSWANIGDAPGIVLSNGTFMLSGYQSFGSAPVALLNASTTPPSWTTIQPTGKATGQDEEGWTLLPNGNILDIDILLKQGEIYNPNTHVWTQTPTIPVQLGDQACYEIGPTVLRPDGTVFALGATSSTAIYHTSNNGWTAGPVVPNSMVVSDGPAAILPNGKVLFGATPAGSPPTTCYGFNIQFFEFDGVSINFTSVPPDTQISQRRTQDSMLLVLPTGQILLTLTTPYEYLYTESGTYTSSWRPTLTSSIPTTLVRGQSNYSMQGKQLNGMTQATSFGDENQNATNYPLARITNSHSGHVRYVRTHAFSSMGVATGSAIVSAQFDIPTNIEIGASTFEVVANGIPSVAVNVNVECTSDGIFCDGMEQVVW